MGRVHVVVASLWSAAARWGGFGELIFQLAGGLPPPSPHPLPIFALAAAGGLLEKVGGEAGRGAGAEGSVPKPGQRKKSKGEGVIGAAGDTGIGPRARARWRGEKGKKWRVLRHGDALRIR